MKLVPTGGACYLHSINACVLDGRVVASESTACAWIASAIVHEATHARLERKGIRYDEAVRYRIELICARRELDFARRLPDPGELIEEINWQIERCKRENASFTDQKMLEEIDQGYEDALRYLGAPEWVIASLFRLRDLIFWLRRFARSMTRAPT